MATLSTRRILVHNKLIKYYLLRSVSPSAKHFSTKGPRDNDAENESNQVTQNKEEQKLSKEKKLDHSLKSESSKDQTKEVAKKKLFSLLSELSISPDQPKIKPDLVLSKPLKRIGKKERFENIKKDIKTPDEEMKNAVNVVAETVGGDTKKTEEELKQKLSSLNLIQGSEQDGDFKDSDMGIDENLQESLMSSVKDVASTVPTPVRSKLTERLLRLSVEKQDKRQPKFSVEKMVEGMKVEKSKVVERKQTPDAKIKEKKIVSRRKVQSRINIFQSPPLDIFSLDDQIEAVSEETVWQNLEKKRLKLLTEFAPSNAFEEMIMWTEQGKHWKFPIDNETEMGEEENVGFHEHVFLDQHLQGFPTRGPIRHFMELVAVGLSKNPYITVERKIENINWFRQYFKEKEDILRDCGAIEEVGMKAS